LAKPNHRGGRILEKSEDIGSCGGNNKCSTQ
jgi:hypothetical protein